MMATRSDMQMTGTVLGKMLRALNPFGRSVAPAPKKTPEALLYKFFQTKQAYVYCLVKSKPGLSLTAREWPEFADPELLRNNKNPAANMYNMLRILADKKELIVRGPQRPTEGKRRINTFRGLP